MCLITSPLKKRKLQLLTETAKSKSGTLNIVKSAYKVLLENGKDIINLKQVMFHSDSSEKLEKLLTK